MGDYEFRSLGSFGAKEPLSPIGERDMRRKVDDPLTGETVFRAELPDSWQVTKVEVDANQPSGSWPFTLFFEAQDRQGAIMRYRTPREWVQTDQSQTMMAAQMGIPTPPNERALEAPAAYLDSFAAEQVGPFATTMRFTGERAWPVAPDKRMSDEMGEGMIRSMREPAIQQMNAMQGGEAVTLDEVRVRSLCRTYAFDWDGADYRMALFSTVQCVRTTMRPIQPQPQAMQGGHPSLFQQGGGFMQKIGDAAQQGMRSLGDMIGNAQQRQQPSQQQQAFGQPFQQQPQQQAPRQTAFGITTIEWGDLYLCALIAPADRFDELYAGAFTAFCGTAAVDPHLGILREQLNMKKMQEQQAEMARRQQQMQSWQQQPQQQDAMTGWNQPAQQAQQPQQQPWPQQQAQPQPGTFQPQGAQPWSQPAQAQSQPQHDWGQPAQSQQQQGWGQQPQPQYQQQPQQTGGWSDLLM